MNEYKPNPMDTGDVALPKELIELTEKIAKNTHHKQMQMNKEIKKLRKELEDMQ